jgi:hypothetical protein
MEAADFLSETLLMYLLDTRCYILSRENRGDILLRNVGKRVPDYSASLPLVCEDELRRLHGITSQKTVRTGISRKQFRKLVTCLQSGMRYGNVRSADCPPTA